MNLINEPEVFIPEQYKYFLGSNHAAIAPIKHTMPEGKRHRSVLQMLHDISKRATATKTRSNNVQPKFVFHELIGILIRDSKSEGSALYGKW